MNLHKDFKILCIALTANFSAETLTLPITVTRVVYQTNNLDLKETFKQIQNRKAYFRGLIPSLTSKATSIALKYTLYQKIKTYRNTKKDDLFNNCVNGFMCGVIGTTITNPLMVWRTQLQRNQKMKLAYSYRGLGYSILRCIPLYTLLFPINDFYKSKFEDKIEEGIKTSILAAGCTSLTNFPIVQPIDYIRTRKAAGLNIEWTWKVWKYYRGGSLALLRNGPHLIIAMTLIDLLNKRFAV